MKAANPGRRRRVLARREVISSLAEALHRVLVFGRAARLMKLQGPAGRRVKTNRATPP